MRNRHELKLAEKKYKKIAIYLALFCSFLLFIHFLIISLIFTWSDWIAILIFSLLLMAPVYLSNASMVFIGGGKPIDGGKFLRDGRRIFGDHKTWNGLLKGPLYFGIPVSIGIFLLFLILWQFIGSAFQFAINADLYVLYGELNYYEYYFIGGPFPIGLISIFIRIIICSYSAGLGDLIGSFLKRRRGIKSGMPFWIVDQLDFVIVVLVFLFIFGFTLPGLFLVPDINIIIFILILTPSITIIGSNIGYYLGIKEFPW